jgi:hypothetical protein
MAGVLRDDVARQRLDDGSGTFIMDGLGVRCVSDRPWTTAAETCECLLAYLAVGRRDQALDLFRAAQALRCDDGHYHTGLVHPDRVTFPGGERTTYTDAAVVMAADAIAGVSPASRLLTDHDALPALINADAVADPSRD